MSCSIDVNDAYHTRCGKCKNCIFIKHFKRFGLSSLKYDKTTPSDDDAW